MAHPIRIKAKPICDYKNRCDYAALTRIGWAKKFEQRRLGRLVGRLSLPLACDLENYSDHNIDIKDPRSLWYSNWLFDVDRV